MKKKIPGPRNPFVAAAKFKKAGAHGKSEKAKRRAANMAVRSGKTDDGLAANNPGGEKFAAPDFTCLTKTLTKVMATFVNVLGAGSRRRHGHRFNWSSHGAA